MKISIGSAQLGLSYGIKNHNKKRLKISDFKKIIKLSKKYKINSIDTAINYGNAEHKIGKLLDELNLNSYFRVTTKLPKIRNQKKKIFN